MGSFTVFSCKQRTLTTMFVITLLLSLALINAQEMAEESPKSDPRVFFANYTSGLYGLFNVNQMFISAMNVVILIAFIIGLTIYYLSSSSTTATALAKEDSAFRGFVNSKSQERSLQILPMVNTAIKFYKELNGQEQD